MTNIDEMIAVLQAARNGKAIQDSIGKGWYDNQYPTWNFGAVQYRVKPEPMVATFRACISGDADGYLVNRLINPNLELEFIDGVLTGAKVL